MYILHPISVGPFRIICPAADIPKDRLRDANGPQAKTESTVVFLGSAGPTKPIGLTNNNLVREPTFS